MLFPNAHSNAGIATQHDQDHLPRIQLHRHPGIYLHFKQKIFKVPDMKLFCCLNKTGGISFFKHFLSISYKAIIFQEPLVFFHLCLQFFQPYILRSFNCPKSCIFLLFQDMIQFLKTLRCFLFSSFTVALGANKRHFRHILYHCGSVQKHT